MIRYQHATGDHEFEVGPGLELLVETARVHRDADRDRALARDRVDPARVGARHRSPLTRRADLTVSLHEEMGADYAADLEESVHRGRLRRADAQ